MKGRALSCTRRPASSLGRVCAWALCCPGGAHPPGGPPPGLQPVTSLLPAFLPQCLEENSDIKTHRPFVAVMTTLCKCKDQASRTFSR